MSISSKLTQYNSNKKLQQFKNKIKLDKLILKRVWKFKKKKTTKKTQTFPCTYGNRIYVRTNGGRKTVLFCFILKTEKLVFYFKKYTNLSCR